MGDVIKIALQRRAELSAEMNQLDEFIRMAENLVHEHGGEKTAKAPAATQPIDGTVSDAEEQPLRNAQSRPMVFRQKASA